MRGLRILIGPLFFWGIVLVPSLAGADAQGIPRSYPLPIAEAERILSQWFTDSGFRVSRSVPEADGIQITAVKENESWKVILRAHSPLASFVQAEYARNGRADPVRLERLWEFLEDYARGVPPEVPPSVLSRVGSVVCLKAVAGGKEIQFSGFISDKRGRILSTAHDLERIREVSVIMEGGREIKGRLLERDAHRDLALVQVGFNLSSPVKPSRGRRELKEGEQVFAVCYTGEGERKILQGVISGFIRRSENLPLWQVDMETPRGASGSPVFDSRGNLVSMVKGRYRGTHSVGFLIPLGTILEFLKGK